MKCVAVTVMVVCVWVGGAQAAAVPPVISIPEEQQQQPHHPMQVTDILSSQSARFFIIPINRVTKTITRTSTTTVPSFVSCYTTEANANVPDCPRARSLSFATTRAAQPDTMMHMTASPMLSSSIDGEEEEEEPEVEYGQLLLPSYVNKDFFLPNERAQHNEIPQPEGRFIFVTRTTTTITSTTSTRDTRSTVSIIYGANGCKPADAPTMMCS